MHGHRFSTWESFRRIGRQCGILSVCYRSALSHRVRLRSGAVLDRLEERIPLRIRTKEINRARKRHEETIRAEVKAARAAKPASTRVAARPAAKPVAKAAAAGTAKAPAAPRAPRAKAVKPATEEVKTESAG